MKTKSAQKSDLPPAQRIQEAYIDSVLTDGKDPVSVYHFARKAGLTEEEFYNEFSGFEGVALSVWKTHLTQVIQSTESNPEYPEFQTREKILLFYFTFFQEFRKIRSYAAYSASRWALPFSKDKVRNEVEQMVQNYFEARIQEGFASGELVERPKISSYYDKALRSQFFLILDFWIRDTSSGFEDTDALIEKSVNLSYALMQENTLDKAFDLVRFLSGRFPVPNF